MTIAPSKRIEPPFPQMGPLHNFNNTDVNRSRYFVAITCQATLIACYAHTIDKPLLFFQNAHCLCSSKIQSIKWLQRFSVLPMEVPPSILLILLRNLFPLSIYTQQTVTALSSTKAEFSAAVAATKVVNDFQSVLNVIPIPSSGPTLIYVDNDLCITVFNRSISFQTHTAR